MGSPQPTPNPITDSNLWQYFTLASYPSPGIIIRGGVKGFKRETGWDKKAGKGSQGATLTLKTLPPCEGTITLALWRALRTTSIAGPGVTFASPLPPQFPGDQVDDFGNWDTFVENVLAIGPKEQVAEGLPISYPAFCSIGLTKVVVEWYTAPEHIRGGLYHVTIKLGEWQQPPPLSVVKTVSTTAPALPAAGAGFLADSPRNVALKAQIARAQANMPNGPGPNAVPP